MLKECFDNVRKSVPLVHNITNYVTVNDVANIILACGASPIMSDEPDDVTDITSICSSLNINIGTLHKSSSDSYNSSVHFPSSLFLFWSVSFVSLRCISLSMSLDILSSVMTA